MNFCGNNYMQDGRICYELLVKEAQEKGFANVQKLIDYVQDSTEGFWIQTWFLFRESLDLSREQWGEYDHYFMNLLPDALQKVGNEDLGAKRNKKNLNFQMFFEKYCLASLNQKYVIIEATGGNGVILFEPPQSINAPAFQRLSEQFKAEFLSTWRHFYEAEQVAGNAGINQLCVLQDMLELILKGEKVEETSFEATYKNVASIN
jgi:hypothetical protein